MRLSKIKERKNVLIYLISDTLSKAVPFLLLPLYTRFLSPEQFGNIAIFNILVEVLMVLVTFGAHNYYRIEYFKTNNKEKLLSNVFANVFILYPIFVLLVCGYIYSGINPGEQSNGWLFVTVIIALTHTLALLVCAKFQCEENAINIGIVNLSSTISAATITVGLLYLGLEEPARYIGYFISSLLMLAVAFLLFSKSGESISPIKYGVSTPGLRFGLGLIPHTLSWWLRSGLERMMIAKYVSLVQVGLFTIAAQISFVLVVFSNAINQAFTPKILNYLAQGEFKKTYFLMFKILIVYVLTTVVFCAGALLGFDLVFSNEYIEAKVILPWLFVSCLLHAMINLLSNVLQFFKKVKTLSLITGGTSVLHIMIVLVIIESHGVFGVLYSSIFTYMCSFVLISSYSVHLLKNHQLNKEIVN